MDVQIGDSWEQLLAGEFDKDYFAELTTAVHEQRRNTIVYPPPSLLFNAFTKCPFDQVKVVILGQDPYHEPKQAMGLAFSVPDETPIPPSLKNIYKEMQADLGMQIPTSGNLEHWSTQGVLLLNAILTVRAGEAGAHQGLGWETFTDTVIKTISAQKENVVFMLWGSYARSKKTLIDTNKHLILEAPHPSPLSAHRGFLGCKHFSKTNEYLKKNGQAAITW